MQNIKNNTKADLHNYINACIDFTRNSTILGRSMDPDVQAPVCHGIGFIFKSCSGFTGCILESYNTWKGNFDGIYVVKQIYKLLSYSDDYAKRPSFHIKKQNHWTKLTPQQLMTEKKG